MSSGFLSLVIIYVKAILDYLIDFLASVYWDSKREVIPSLDDVSKVLLESATVLARKIKTKQIKSEELVRICIQRIQQVNPILNAVTDERFEAALAEAKEVDNLIASKSSDDIFKDKPFLGVPFTAKESYMVQGMRHTLGLVSRKGMRGDTDAEAVRLMRESGAILIAITNVPEINKWQETRNMLFGQTTNPYHTGRTVGGSSGGEAALVAAVASPIGLCTDIGGSTRMPAFYCGLFGHNPTAGTTNMRGATFRTGEEKDSMVSCGPVVKHSEDLIPLMKVLSAEKANSLNLDAPVDLNKLKYYYVEKTGDLRCSAIEPDIRECMKRVISNLSETVAKSNPPRKVEFEGFKYMYRLWRYWMTREPADFALLLGNNIYRVNGVVELAKKLIGCSQFSMAAIFSLIDLQVFPQEKQSFAEPMTKKLKEELLATLGSDGVLIFYSTTHPAPYHYTALFRPFNFGYWGIWNALRFPSTQVPLGLNCYGIPVGIQVVAAPHNDRLCLAVASHLEKAFGGFVPPCTTF